MVSTRAFLRTFPMLFLLAGALGATELTPEGEILAVHDDMREFLAKRVHPKLDELGRMRELMDAIFGRKGLDIQYGSDETRTAAETFAARSGNCLAFTNLFVALGRELGLSVYFQEVDDIMTWDLRGEVMINNKHMFAVVEIDNGHYQVDFLRREREREYRFVKRISDRRAMAHYYNNLGADLLVRGELEAALAHFEKALLLDETLASAWINKGVAHRRQKEFTKAERAYRRAQDMDRSELAVYSNLALLYREWGRDEEAETYFAKATTYRERNPFHHYRLGSHELELGNLREALEYFKKAVIRGPDEAELQFALGDAYYRLGDREKARVHLQRACRLAESEDQRQHFQRALEAVENL